MKICCRCKKSKCLDKFSRSSRSLDGRQSHCKKCAKLYYHQNKHKHIKGVLKRNKIKKALLKKYVWDFLKENPCVDCGESDPIVLHFDHVRGSKRDQVSNLMSSSLRVVKEEIEKCEVRCANCHKRKTHKQFNYYIGD